MPKVYKEAAVAVGSYEDRNTGQRKNRYRNVGVLMEGEDNGERYFFLLLDRSFNPAGVPFKPDSDKIVINLFEPRDDDKRPSNQGGYSQEGPQSENPGAGIEDEVPF
jgi:hypothetical protein